MPPSTGTYKCCISMLLKIQGLHDNAKEGEIEDNTYAILYTLIGSEAEQELRDDCVSIPARFYEGRVVQSLDRNSKLKEHFGI